MKPLLKALSSYFPNGLPMDTGAVACLALIATFLGLLFWQALSKGMATRLENWFKAHSQMAILLFASTLPLLACFVTRSWYAAGIVSVVGLAALLLEVVGKLKWRLRFVVLAMGFVVVAAAGFQFWRDWRIRTIEDRRLKVYVILPVALPLQARLDDDEKQRVILSKRLREEIGDIFLPIVDITVRPATYSLNDLDDWKEMRAAVERVRREGLQADLVMVNEASMTGADEIFLSLVMRVKVHSPDGGEDGFEDLAQISQLGRLRNLSYLALRASLQMIEGLRGTALALTIEDENRISRRILERYQSLLDLGKAEEPAPPIVAQAVQQGLRSKVLSYARVKELVNAYPYDESERLRELREPRSRVWLSRIEGLDLPVMATLKPAATTEGL